MPALPEPSPAKVLFVCTGNQCRSPMGEALLRHLVAGRCDLEIGSAGTVGDGTPPPDHAVAVMAERGLDIAGRPSRPLTAEELAGSDLVVVMGRQHLLDVATLYPPAWDLTFTITDLVERAGAAGGRTEGETLSQWARRMSAGRTRAGVLAAGSAGDIPDPIGGSRRDFERVRDRLETLVAALAPCVCPGLTPAPQGSASGETRPRWWRRG